jgi:hypothetical protein
MANFLITCCIMFATLSAATASTSGLRLHEKRQQGQAEHAKGDVMDKENVRSHSMIAKAPEVEHQLTVCNAYASQNFLEIVQVSTRELLTENQPLAYKQCRDFTLPLREGEQLDFKVGDLDVGTFFANGLPKSSASLLLIPQRKSPSAVSCSFQSHAFADVQSPQIAVIDAYRGKSGKAPGAVKIMESVAPSGNKDAVAEEAMEEELKFNSVMAVNPGKYKISLTGTTSISNPAAPLNAVGSAKFVVMRLGNEDESAYPQELVVFPNASVRMGFSFVIVAVAAFLSLRDLI